jgi:hypothetical protein
VEHLKNPDVRRDYGWKAGRNGFHQHQREILGGRRKQQHVRGGEPAVPRGAGSVSSEMHTVADAEPDRLGTQLRTHRRITPAHEI